MKPDIENAADAKKPGDAKEDAKKPVKKFKSKNLSNAKTAMNPLVAKKMASMVASNKSDSAA